MTPAPLTPDIATESAPGQEPDTSAASAPVAAKLKTNLNLPEDRLQYLITRAMTRIKEVSGEMGRQDSGQVQSQSWMGKRQQYQAEYDNSWEWRVGLGGIFEYSNFSLNVSKRYARLMGAKTRDDLVGTEPFFATMPTEHGDPQLAKDVEWYLQQEIGRSNTKKAIAGAQKTALIRNECVTKQSYQVRSTHFRGSAKVAVGPFAYDGPAGQVTTAVGEPILTPKGNYIYPKDNVIEDANVKGLFRLEKEPSVSFSTSFEYADFPDLDQTLVAYEGLDVRELDYRDFLCPLTAPSVHEADINVHLFDQEFESLRATYGIFEVSDIYLQNAPKSGEKAAKEDQGENTEGSSSEVISLVNCADVYIRCDADNDGLEEEIWLLLDVTNEKAIWYDYLGNHMKKRPFEVIVGIEQVAGRWYGVGVFETLSHKQLYIDTQFNRVNFKSSKSSTLRFRNKNAVEQWRGGGEIVLGDDQFYDIIDQRFDSRNPPAFQVSFAEVDPFAMNLMELMIQAGQTEVGIVGPDDGGMAGLDSTKLATGIKSLERTGNQLMKHTEAEHGAAIEAILEQCTDIVLEHMDEDELIFRHDTGTLLELNREEIRRIQRNVRLLLTRSRSTETIETARMVIQLCREYYEALNPFERYKLRGEYVRQLKALEVQDADGLLDEVTKEQADAFLQQQNKPPVTPPKESIATKYGDLARTEQEQVLRSQGIQPASAQDLAKQTTDDVAKIAAEAKVKADAAAAAKPATNGSRPSN